MKKNRWYNYVVGFKCVISWWSRRALTAEAYVPQSVDNPNNLGIYLSIYVQLVLDKMKDYQKKIGLEHAFMIETGMT